MGEKLKYKQANIIVQKLTVYFKILQFDVSVLVIIFIAEVIAIVIVSFRFEGSGNGTKKRGEYSYR
jgi:hypothetical protein